MIEFLIMDVDGTLTDGKIYMSPDGEIMKAFNAKDGLGIHDILIPAGVTPVILTGRNSNIVRKRCEELGITALYQGVSDKATQLKLITQDLSTVAYIGDDINDIAAMKKVKDSEGMVACPADAVDSVKAIADYICARNGGEGAVREFIEWLLK